MRIHEKPQTFSRILAYVNESYYWSHSSDLHRDTKCRSEELSTRRKGGKLKFKSRRFVLDIRKNFLVESWLRSCTCTVVPKFPQDIIGCFPFIEIKREMKHSVSRATRYGPSWRHELKFMSGGLRSTFAESVIIHILLIHIRIIFIFL